MIFPKFQLIQQDYDALSAALKVVKSMLVDSELSNQSLSLIEKYHIEKLYNVKKISGLLSTLVFEFRSYITSVEQHHHTELKSLINGIIPLISGELRLHPQPNIAIIEAYLDIFNMMLNLNQLAFDKNLPAEKIREIFSTIEKNFENITIYLMDDEESHPFEMWRVVHRQLLDAREHNLNQYYSSNVNPNELSSFVERRAHEHPDSLPIEIILNSKNYTSFIIELNAFALLCRYIDEIVAGTKPATSIIFYPNHTSFHCVTLKVAFNSSMQKLEVIAIDTTIHPALKKVMRLLLEKYPNLNAIMSMNDYQKGSAECRMFGYLLCDELYPHLDFNALWAKEGNAQPKINDQGAGYFNELENFLENHPRVKWLPSYAIGEKFIVMAQSLQLMRAEWAKLSAPEKTFSLEYFINLHDLNSQQKQYYIDVRRDKLRNISSQANIDTQNNLVFSIEQRLSSCFESLFLDGKNGDSPMPVMPPPLFKTPGSEDMGVSFRKAANDNTLEIVKKIYHDFPFVLDMQGHSSKHTALHRAAGNGHLDIVKFLLEKGADITLKDRKGMTARQLAILYHYLVVAEIIHLQDCLKFRNAANKGDITQLEKYYRPEVINTQSKESGNTALHWAARNGYALAVKWLIKHAADVSLTNKKGKTPKLLAQENNHYSTVDIFNLEESVRANSSILNAL